MYKVAFMKAFVLYSCQVFRSLSFSQLQSGRGGNSSDKFPSFELVLSFVGNEALSEEKVSSLLKQRSESARAVAQTYGFIADYIEMAEVHGMFEVSEAIMKYGGVKIHECVYLFLSVSPQLPGLAFLQQLLAKQKHFPK